MVFKHQQESFTMAAIDTVTAPKKLTSSFDASCSASEAEFSPVGVNQNNFHMIAALLRSAVPHFSVSHARVSSTFVTQARFLHGSLCAMSSGDKPQGMATEGLPKGPEIEEHTQVSTRGFPWCYIAPKHVFAAVPPCLGPFSIPLWRHPSGAGGPAWHPG